MNIFKYFKKRSENQFQINSSINTVEKNNVVYAAYYNDIGDGYSNIECTITTPFNSQKHSFSIDAKIPNKLIKDDKPVILPISDKEKDFVIFSFPEEQKKLSVASYTRYQVDLKPNSIKATPHGEKISLSNNAKLSHSSNKYHSYSKPKAMELPNGDIIVAAVDSYSESSEFDRPDKKYVTAWLLERGQNLEFNVNEGSNKVTNRLLFKVGENVESSLQLLLAKQNSNVGKIIYSDSTSLFFLDITESMIDDIREGKYVNNEDEECLFAVGKERCDQFDKKISTPFLTSKGISNLSAVNTENGAVVAFLENEQQLCLAKLTGKKGKKQIVHNYKEKIKSLQLSVVGENDIIVSAVGEKNIIQSTINSENLKVITTRDFPADGVKTLADFMDIVYNNSLKLTTSFPYTIFSSSDAPQISSEASTVPVTSPLSTTTTEEITTKESTTTIEGDTTGAATTEATTQRTTTKSETTKHTTVTTTASTKQPTTTTSLQTTASTERATTTAKTTAETSTAQHTTAGQSTIFTTIPTTQPPKITTLVEKTTISTNPTTSQTAKATSHTISSTPKISSSIVSITSPLATEEITTRGSTITVEKDTTNAATTGATTASTTQPTTTERATTTAETTTETSTTQYTTTTKTTQPTTVTSSKTTTSTEKTTVSTEPSTNQTTKTSTIKITSPTTKPTKATEKSTARSTSRYTTSTKQGSTTVISTSSPKSTTTEMQSTTVLGLTTLASTIGSAVVTTLGLVTQNVTNMITTNSMITDSSPNLNQTDVSSNYEEKSLNTAEISTAIVIPIVVMIGMSYLIYRNCCRSNMRLPSDYTDDISCLQHLRRYFRSCFNGQVPELQLDSLGYNANQVDNSEHEINQNSQSNSTEDLLKRNQNGGAYSTFTSTNNTDLEAGQRDRSNSQKSNDSMEWDSEGDTGSVRYREEDGATQSKTNVNLELNNVKINDGIDQSRQIEISDSPV
ncbi:MAG: hypothetical protein sL5_06980 [Candidatus Mesenet longicola]|uniref:Uncharacterized protein n=1 Tax=Candidatus Mesenet longicola TaxID=1892558 RepID=A0A8J3MPA0_9RICK|nr:MAG: hypothetical protein sGL2_07360 [Candidatus Mesenet longicola]GHM59705.1 MAG: hypothetical protein sL5_06980 [Candidatus Mesenet longicola]